MAARTASTLWLLSLARESTRYPRPDYGWADAICGPCRGDESLGVSWPEPGLLVGEGLGRSLAVVGDE